MNNKEIKFQSSANYNNFSYDQTPKILNETPKTITQARYSKIKHNSGKEDPVLKIWRQGLNKQDLIFSNQVDGMIEFIRKNCDLDENKFEEIKRIIETPKSKNQITLDETSIEALIEYLSYYFKIKDGAGHVVKVDNKTSAIIKIIQDSEIKNSQDFLPIFNELIKKTDIKQISEAIVKSNLSYIDIQKALEVRKKEDALNEFRERLKDPTLQEDKGPNHWQGWFEKNKWLFGSEYITILNQRTLDENDTTDFLAKSCGGFLEIIEIKSPNLAVGKIFANDPNDKQGKTYNAYYPISELTKAISQCFRYISKIEKQSDDNKKYEGCQILKPRCFLLFGRSNCFNQDQQEALRIINSHYNNFCIITYDQLLERAERSLKSFCSENNKAPQQENNTSWEDEEIPF
jgi:hypothetical protein